MSAPTVAYLGPEATFAHQACLRKFGPAVNAQPAATVIDVFEAVANGAGDYGVVPVENSTEGAVTVTFDLFQDTSVLIGGELYLTVHQNLMANCALHEIRVVYSHPQSLAQCRHWLHANLPGIECRELNSNSAAAQRAASEPHAAAIAGIMAAARYGVRVLAPSIEDLAENITRFLVLTRAPLARTGDDKTSIMFAVSDRVGALFDALLPFKHAGVNLSMIQSRPSKRRAWDYLFFVDFIGHADDPAPAAALAELAQHCKMVKTLGSYPRSPEAVE